MAMAVRSRFGTGRADFALTVLCWVLGGGVNIVSEDEIWVFYIDD